MLIPQSFSVSNFASFLLKFDQHQMAIIEVDGVYTVKQSTDLIYITAGQRYSVLITAKATAPGQNYAFVGAMDPDMFDCNPCSNVPLNATGYLVYDSSKPLPNSEPTFPSYTSGFYDDFNLVPYDKQPLLGPVTKRITLNVESGTYFNQNR
jgi:iron transport multicopper oxidase